MTKLDYSKTNKSDTAFLNDPYWTNPKTGFDKAWHIAKAQQKTKLESQVKNLKKILNTHVDHDWQPVKNEKGPHSGKIICNTCNGKFVNWLPKDYTF
jgi:adenine specific DNA methylase Mod